VHGQSLGAYVNTQVRTGSLCHTFLPHNSVHILLRYQTTFFSHITPSVCTKIFVVMSAPNSQYYESVVNLQVPNLPTSPSYPPISFPSCCQPALPNMISLPSVLRYAQSLACWFPLPELVTRTDTQPQGPLSASPTWPYSHLPTPQRSVGIYIFCTRDFQAIPVLTILLAMLETNLRPRNLRSMICMRPRAFFLNTFSIPFF